MSDSRRSLELQEGEPGISWQPQWTVDCGTECQVGILIDDHCLVFLVRAWEGHWMPTTHIPLEAARQVLALLN